jgi:hypothetical protein
MEAQNSESKSKIKFTPDQRKTINKMAHERATCLYPMEQYLSNYRRSKVYYRTIITRLMEAGFDFDEVKDLAKDQKIAAVKLANAEMQETRDALLAIKIPHPYLKRRG